jgi:hypothetical protein
MRPAPDRVTEHTLNLDYSIRGIGEAFRRLCYSPKETTAQERWLAAMAKCETASEEYLAAVRSRSAL